jgi:hypothetical protein
MSPEVVAREGWSAKKSPEGFRGFACHLPSRLGGRFRTIAAYLGFSTEPVFHVMSIVPTASFIQFIGAGADLFFQVLGWFVANKRRRLLRRHGKSSFLSFHGVEIRSGGRRTSGTSIYKNRTPVWGGVRCPILVQRFWGRARRTICDVYNL